MIEFARGLKKWTAALENTKPEPEPEPEPSRSRAGAGAGAGTARIGGLAYGWRQSAGDPGGCCPGLLLPATRRRAAGRWQPQHTICGLHGAKAATAAVPRSKLMLIRQLFDFCYQLTRLAMQKSQAARRMGWPVDHSRVDCAGPSKHGARIMPTRKDRSALVRVVELLIQRPSLLDDPPAPSQALQVLQRQQAKEQLHLRRSSRPAPPWGHNAVEDACRVESTDIASVHGQAACGNVATTRAVGKHLSSLATISAPRTTSRSTAPGDRHAWKHSAGGRFVTNSRLRNRPIAVSWNARLTSTASEREWRPTSHGCRACEVRWVGRRCFTATSHAGTRGVSWSAQSSAPPWDRGPVGANALAVADLGRRPDTATGLILPDWRRAKRAQAHGYEKIEIEELRVNSATCGALAAAAAVVQYILVPLLVFHKRLQYVGCATAAYTPPTVAKNLYIYLVPESCLCLAG